MRLVRKYWQCLSEMLCLSWTDTSLIENMADITSMTRRHCQNSTTTSTTQHSAGTRPKYPGSTADLRQDEMALESRSTRVRSNISPVEITSSDSSPERERGARPSASIPHGNNLAGAETEKKQANGKGRLRFWKESLGLRGVCIVCLSHDVIRYHQMSRFSLQG